MDFWHNQNTMSDEEFFERRNGTYEQPSFSEDETQEDSGRTYGSNGGLSDGSDSWKYGG